jgi:SAM-dependent methyltransferase
MNNTQPVCLCGSQDFTKYIEGYYNFFLVNDAPVLFQGLRCKNCGLLVTNPPPKEHIACMNGGASIVIEHEEEDVVAKSVYRLEKIRPFLQSHWKVLEIGCSSGKLVELIKQAGADESVGVDLFQPMATFARQHGRDVLCQSLELCNFPDRHFNLIHAHHLLEHVPNLHAMIAEMSRILVEGGLLYFTVPNYVSPLARSTNWSGWFPQEHYWHFNGNTLRALFEAKGFRLQQLSFPMHSDFADSQGVLGTAKRLVKDTFRTCRLGDTIEAWFQKVD